MKIKAVAGFFIIGLFSTTLTFCGEILTNQSSRAVVEPEEIARMALKHSIDLKLLTREYDAADAQFQRARGEAYPQLGVDARYTRYAGLTSFSIPPYLSIPVIENRYNAGATISQPIYTGGRLKSLRAAAELLKSSITEERKSAESFIILQACELYWNWSKAYHQLQALESAVNRMESHARDIRNLRNAGMATENDALATEVLLEQTRLRYEEARRRLELVRASIVFLTGEEFLTNWVPLKPSVSESVKIPQEDELLKTAMSSRPERSARIYEAQSLDERVKTAQAEYYPQVSVVARYEQARPNLLDFPPRDRWQDDAFAGVVVSWNIFDRGIRSAKVREASARRDQAHLKLEKLVDQILYEIRSARIKLMDACQRLEVSKRLLASAEKNLNVATDLWKNGLARHSEVLDAHSQFTDAQFAVISDSADINIALIGLQYATGNIDVTKIKSVK